MSNYQKHTTPCAFTGINLRDPADMLQDGQWTRATNIRSRQEGSITSRPGRKTVIPQLTDVTVPNPTYMPVNTLFKLEDAIISSVNGVVYRNGQAYPSTWWSGPKKFVRHRGSEGEKKWAYVADPTNLRMIGADGTDYKWGITAPTLAATYQATGTGPLNSSVAGAIVYDWRYTWINSKTGAESNPSPTGTSIAVVNKNATTTVWSSADPQVNRIAIYRRGGTLVDTWRRVAIVNNMTDRNGRPQAVTFIDNNSDSAISLAAQLKLDNDVPFTSVDTVGDVLREAPIPYIFGPFLGLYIFACGDPNRPGHLYWTNPGRPTSASLDNHIAVTAPDEPLLGGIIYNDLPYVYSREAWYAIDYQGADALVPFTTRKLPIGRGVSAPYAVDVGPVVYFLSKDNIYASDMQGSADPLTEENLRPLFNPNVEDYDYSAPGAIAPINWDPYNITPPSLQDPSSGLNTIKLRFGGQYLHLFYRDVNGTYVHLVNHLPYNRWSNDETGYIEETEAYYDHEQPNASLLLGCNDGRVAREEGTDDYGINEIQCRARARSFDFGMPHTFKEIGNVIIDANVNGAHRPNADGGGNGVVVQAYYNAEASTGTVNTINGTGRLKYPLGMEDTYVYSFALEFRWNGNATIYQYETLWRPDQELINHWEFPPTTFGSKGWTHMRDLYLTLRSIGTVNITVEIDGVNYLPAIAGGGAGSIPSTSGAKTKFHLWLPPVKGKLYRVIMYGGPFRLYGDDCEIRLKEWLTGLSYPIVNPFAGMNESI